MDDGCKLILGYYASGLIGTVLVIAGVASAAVSSIIVGLLFAAAGVLLIVNAWHLLKKLFG